MPITNHCKISSCTQYREAQKSRWLTKCIEELKTNSSWVLPALKHIREICCLYQEAPHNTAPSAHHTQRQVKKFECDQLLSLRSMYMI